MTSVNPGLSDEESLNSKLSSNSKQSIKSKPKQQVNENGGRRRSLSGPSIKSPYGSNFSFSADLENAEATYQIRSYSMEDIRVIIKKFMSSSLFGQIYNNILLVISIFSSIEFMYQTYLNASSDSYDNQSSVLNLLEKIIASIFMFDWCLNFFMADHKVIFMTSFFSMVDIFSVIPIWVTDGKACPDVYNITTFGEVVLYILFAMATTRVLRALRIRRKLQNIDDVVSRSLGEICLSVAVMILFFAAMIQFLEITTQPEYQYHTWMYYILVSISTVGYGDIYPISLLGRFFVMGMILFSIITIPKMTNDLIEKMKLQSIYERAIYTPKGKYSRHVVICGDITSTSIVDLFEELFHEDHENDDINAVLLLQVPPTKEIIFLMRSSKYLLSVTYLQGSALIDHDLKRAKIELAEAVFIITNKFSVTPDEEDASSILLNFSIKRYLKNHHTATSENMLYCMQLIRPENQRHMSQETLKDVDEGTVVICLSEIKMGVLAKALIYPGSNIFIMNLITTSTDADDDEDEEEGGDDNEIGADNSKQWIKEYQKGCDWEIYNTGLSEIFDGARFCDLSYALYEKMGIVLFALLIHDLEDNNSSKIFLNPAEYIINSDKRYKVEAFVMAKNKAESDLTFPDLASSPNGWEIKNFKMHRVSTMLVHHDGDKHRNSDVDGFQRKASAYFTRGKQPSIAMTRNVGPIENHFHSISETDEAEAAAPAAKKSKWGLLKRSALLEKKVQSLSKQEILQELEDAHFIKNYYIRVFPVELTDVTVKSSLSEEFPSIKNHVIIIGKGLNNLFDLVRPLRAKYLGKMSPIVILYPYDIPDDIWHRINMFDAILFVRGSPLEENHLRRAGVFRAAKVLVLADGSNPQSGKSTDGKNGLEALVDSDAIFSYQCVRRMNPHAQVVVEMVNVTNIGFLDTDFNKNGGNYRSTPQFAAGTLFTTSLLDSLVCQAYYNPEIIKLVSKMISGIDQMERSEFVFEATKRAAENSEKPESSSDEESLNEEDDDDDDEEVVEKKKIGKKINLLKKIKSSCLYQIPVPDYIKGSNKQYGTLYQYLASKKMIPLGLLRGVSPSTSVGPKGNKLPYVYTNPEKTVEVYPNDMVFVLALKPPHISDKTNIEEWLIAVQKEHEKEEKIRVDSSKRAALNIAAKKKLSVVTNSSVNSIPTDDSVDQTVLTDIDVKVTQLSTDVEKKLSDIFVLLEDLMTKESPNNKTPYRKYSTQSNNTGITTLTGESTNNGSSNCLSAEDIKNGIEEVKDHSPSIQSFKQSMIHISSSKIFTADESISPTKIIIDPNSLCATPMTPLMREDSSPQTSHKSIKNSNSKFITVNTLPGPNIESILSHSILTPSMKNNRSQILAEKRLKSITK